MKAPKVKTTTIETPKVAEPAKAAEPVSDYFIPPGYSSHVTAHRRMDYIKCSDHSYTKRAEIAALITWLEAQMPTLAE